MRSRERVGEVLFSAFFVALGIFALLQTGPWPIKAALYPRFAGSALVIAGLICGVLTSLGREDKTTARVELEFESKLPPAELRARTLESLAWIGGFLVAGWLVGLIPAMVLLVLAYLRWVGQEPWWLVGVMTVGTWVALEAFMVRLLHLPIPTGILPALLGR